MTSLLNWLPNEEDDQIVFDFDRSDDVNRPSHYISEGGLEAIDVIEAFGLGYRLGNVIKYTLRAGKKDKDSFIKDLRKAIWYLNREIEKNGGGPAASGGGQSSEG